MSIDIGMMDERFFSDVENIEDDVDDGLHPHLNICDSVLRATIM